MLSVLALFLQGLNVMAFLLLEGILNVVMLVTLFKLYRSLSSGKRKVLWFLAGVILLIDAYGILALVFSSASVTRFLGFFFALLLLSFFTLFKLSFAKQGVKGTVLSSNGKVTVVQVDEEALSLTPRRKLVIESRKKFKEGCLVHVKFKRSLLKREAFIEET